MKRAKTFFKSLANPPAATVICFWTAGLILLGGCIASIVLDVWNVGIRIAVIILMSLLVSYAAYGTAKLLRLLERIKAWAKNHPRIYAFLHNYHIRTVLLTFGSIVIDVGYATMEFIIGKMTNHSWYTINATYYFSLSVVRLLVIIYARPNAKLPPKKRAERELKAYTATGIALFLINGWLTTTFEVSLTGGSEFARNKLIVYGTAVYTFYRIVVAIVGLVVSHTKNNLVTRALNAISTVTALVSVLTFFTTLAATFRELKGVLVANGIIGNIISLFTISMSVFMIIKSYRYNKKASEQAEAQENTE